MLLRSIYLLLALPLAVGCADDEIATQALFVLPSDDAQGFFALPYPNDLRLGVNGHVDLEALPRPNTFLADYFDTIEQLQTGFGLTSAGILRFDGPIDTRSLPSEPGLSKLADASVYLVNVEPASEHYGVKTPLEFDFHQEPGEVIGTNWLSCLPFPGFVLEEGSTYALVATDRLLDEQGAPIRASSTFLSILDVASSTSEVEVAKNIYDPLLRWLDEEGGDERRDVVSAAVFTTQRPTELMGRFRQVIHESVASPIPREVALKVDRSSYSVYTGRYDSPNFQDGEFPYKTLEQGGGFELDASGDPIVQTTEDLRFSMTIPTEVAMPSAGWPVVLYAHGTSGDYLSYEQNGTAARMAEQGLAVISIDQLMHGERLSQGSAENLFFNFQNPLSSRANVMQAALEDYQLLRLVQGVDQDVEGRALRFDSSKIFFFGHSQGSVTGVPFAAHEPDVKGAVFSGAGGLLYLTLTTKKKPFDVREILGLVIRDANINRFHPVLALLQAFYEPADAIVYARLLVQEPPPGLAPKNIFQPHGFDDSYTTEPTLKALATAFGVHLVAPELKPIAGLKLQGKQVLSLPVTNNAGDVTAVAAQYQPRNGEDGHFVSFDIPAARKQSALFLKTLADTGKATLVVP